jgi:hypothetical protein
MTLFDVVNAGAEDDEIELPSDVAPPHAAKTTASPANNVLFLKRMFIDYLLMNSYSYTLQREIIKMMKNVLSFVNAH